MSYDRQDDIDYRINLAFDINYNEKTTKCYSVKSPSKTNLETIANFKKVVDGERLTKLVSQIFNPKETKFSLTRKKKYDGRLTLTYKRGSKKSEHSTVQIGTYKQGVSMDDPKIPENVHKVMSYLLSTELIGYKLTQGILFPLMNIDIPFKELAPYLKDVPSLEELVPVVESGEVNTTLSVVISEHYYKMRRLDEYLKEIDNSTALKVLLFQIVHTLAVIQKKYPGFRHNQLTAEHIYLYQNKVKMEKAKRYTFEGVVYHVPRAGFDVKVSDFEKSVISGLVENDGLEEDMKKQDQSYDIQTIITSLGDKVPDKLKKLSQFKSASDALSLFDNFKTGSTKEQVKGASEDVSEQKEVEIVVPELDTEIEDSDADTEVDLDAVETPETSVVEQKEEPETSEIEDQDLDAVDTPESLAEEDVVVTEEEVVESEESEEVVNPNISGRVLDLSDDEALLSLGEWDTEDSVSRASVTNINKIGSFLGATNDDLDPEYQRRQGRFNLPSAPESGMQDMRFGVDARQPLPMKPVGDVRPLTPPAKLNSLGSFLGATENDLKSQQGGGINGLGSFLGATENDLKGMSAQRANNVGSLAQGRAQGVMPDAKINSLGSFLGATDEELTATPELRDGAGALSDDSPVSPIVETRGKKSKKSKGKKSKKSKGKKGKTKGKKRNTKTQKREVVEESPEESPEEPIASPVPQYQQNTGVKGLLGAPTGTNSNPMNLPPHVLQEIYAKQNYGPYGPQPSPHDLEPNPGVPVPDVNPQLLHPPYGPNVYGPHGPHGPRPRCPHNPPCPHGCPYEQTQGQIMIPQAMIPPGQQTMIPQAMMNPSTMNQAEMLQKLQELGNVPPGNEVPSHILEGLQAQQMLDQPQQVPMDYQQILSQLPEGFSGQLPEGFSGQLPDNLAMNMPRPQSPPQPVMNPQQILSQLPEGFSGQLPDHIAMSLPQPQTQQQPMMNPQQIISQLPEGFSGQIPENIAMNMPSPQQLPQANMVPIPQQVNSQRALPPIMNQEQILSKLPEGFNGQIPDHLLMQANATPNPNMQGVPPYVQHMLAQRGGSQEEKKDFQEGGSGRIIPMYKDARNTPFKSTEHKKLDTKRFKEKKKPPESPQSLFEFKIHDTLLKHAQAKLPPKKQEIYPSTYVPVPNPWYPYAKNAYFPWQYTPNNVPVVKNYNISLSGAGGDPIKVGALFEDMLPPDMKHTFSTIGERLIMYNYIRSILVKHGDGEEIDIAGSGKTGRIHLLSYIKLLEVNPYHYSSITNNPYYDLPDRMLLYRSGYPVRIDEKTNRVYCAKESVGINVRIYEMSYGELYIKSLTSGMDHQDFDLWREIAYYEHVREKITKEKKSPNFITMYSYYITSETGVDFEKIRQIKRQYRNDNYNNQSKEQDKLINKQFKEGLERRVLPSHLGPTESKLYENLMKAIVPVPQLARKVGTGPAIEIEITKASGKNLIALTEAPTYNILNWARKTYLQSGYSPIRKMINTGYHSAKVWKSVVFQLLAALYCLYKEEIAFNTFTLQDNVYIKDLVTSDQTVGHWLYKINGIDYYVPNHGYLVVIDSNFKDLEEKGYTLQRGGDRRVYKLYDGKMFEKNNTDGQDFQTFLNNLTHTHLSNIINPNNFGQEFTNGGGIAPPEEVLGLLSSLHDDIVNAGTVTQDIFDSLIFENMREYLNNRIGTYLRESEIQFVSDNEEKEFKKGEVIPFFIRDNTYIWAIYLDNAGGDNVRILTKDPDGNTGIIEMEVHISSCRKYTSSKEVEQDYKPQTAKLSMNARLETYVC